MIKNDNSDYKQYNAGMHNPLNEKIRGGKNKKKKITKKTIKKILKFKL
jgi:hypothetical protein